MKKTILYLCAAGLMLGASVVAAGAWYLRSARPDYGRDAALPGLSAPVEVWRDSLAVPHIWAANELDLVRALGYVHAQDRLWQMELFRRVADGRLAEVLGAEALSSDRFLRTVGMGRAAGAAEQGLDAGARALMQAYADGVNRWIREHPGALPPEFLALRFEPEPWTVRNSLAIGKIMAWDLADWEAGLNLARAEAQVGAELAAALYPRYPEWGPHILGSEAEWRGKGSVQPHSRPAAPRPAARLGADHLPAIPPLARRLLDAGSMVRASNSWVVAGSRTRSGKPILANDPHLALRAPSLWMVAALHSGGIDVAGVTIPGVPAVVLGHTPGVAWGFTNAMVDDVDFYVERLDPQDSTRYLTPSGWRPLEVRAETIQVRGAEPVVHRVRVTRNGPVLSDVDRRAGEGAVAMRWTGLEPSREHVALLAMNRARSADELVEALRHFDSPHQNVVFADTAGNIGYRMVGRVPVRRAGDGVLPVPGWTDDYAWESTLHFDEHPHLLNPAEGFIVTANNRQVGPEYPFLLGTGYADPFRAARIRQMLHGARALTAADVARQQNDVLDLFALRYRDHAVRAAEDAGDAGTAAALRAWDGRAATESRAAAVFYTWYEELRRRVGQDEYGSAAMYFPRAAMNAILDAGDGAWVDDVRTGRRETLRELARGAMREAVSTAGGRTWGELHTTHMEHVLGASELLDDALKLNIGPFPNDGSPFTVDVAGYGTRPPFRNSYGASMRHVVDMAQPDAAGGFVVPTGQSGHPMSRHYRDQTDLWREGRLWLVPLARAAAEARAVRRMRLVP